MNRGRHKKKKIIPLSDFRTPDGKMIKQNYYVKAFKDDEMVFNEKLPFEQMHYIHVYDWIRSRIYFSGWNKITINDQTITI